MYSSEPALAARANATTVGLTALHRAAELGNPDARYMVANAALAVGFWPMVSVATTCYCCEESEGSYGSDSSNSYHSDNSLASALPHLQVHDTWNPKYVQQQQQLAQAYLYWRMAAISGHVEAAMTLAHRLVPAYIAAGTGSGGGGTNTRTSTNHRPMQYVSGFFTSSTANNGMYLSSYWLRRQQHRRVVGLVLAQQVQSPLVQLPPREDSSWQWTSTGSLSS
jgi:hypothetical protein